VRRVFLQPAVRDQIPDAVHLGGDAAASSPTRSFDLPTEFGITLPDAVATNSLIRRKLVDIDDGDVRRRVDFDRPSNVMFVPPEYATINCGIGCTFNGITLRANGSTGPISVFTGNVVSLLASKNSGSGCQLLLCSFTDNGSPIPSNGLNSTTHVFTTAGTHIVAAGCECSPCDLLGDDIVTVNVTSCATGVSLQHETVSTVPANRGRTKLGVGEQVTLWLSPNPPCGVSWSLIGPGSLSTTSGNVTTFTAHNAASSTTVRATVGGTPLEVSFNVVEPASQTGAISSVLSFPAGTQGAGMILNVTVHPTDVSFLNVEILELPGPATNIFGYFATYPPAQLAHSPNPNWVRLSASNGLNDTASQSGHPPPWSLGGFLWDIPVRWRVVNTTTQGTLPNRVQTFQIANATGTTTVAKLGQSVTRSP
jgi:hypothetical protein